MGSSEITAYRARILHFTAVPDPRTGVGVEYFDDGVLLVERGRIKALASATDLALQG